MLELYKNIKSRRQELGLTQSELATKVGYTNKSTIATIEAGKINLPLSKIREFAVALECSASDLMGWDEPLTKDNAQERGKFDAELIIKFHKLNAGNQAVVMGLIDNLLNNQ